MKSKFISAFLAAITLALLIVLAAHAFYNVKSVYRTGIVTQRDSQQYHLFPAYGTDKTDATYSSVTVAYKDIYYVLAPTRPVFVGQQVTIRCDQYPLGYESCRLQ